MTGKERQGLIELTVQWRSAERELMNCQSQSKRIELDAKVQELYRKQYFMRVNLGADFVDIINAAENIIEPGSDPLFWLGDKGFLD